VVDGVGSCGGAPETLAAVFAAQPGVEPLGGLPAQAQVGLVAGRIVKRVAVVRAAFLLGLGVGVVAGQAPLGREPPAGCQLAAPGDGFVDVDRPVEGAVAGVALVAEAGTDGAVPGTGARNGHAAGDVLPFAVDDGFGADLVGELVLEQGDVGVEAGEAVEVQAQLGALAGFRLQRR